MVKKEVACYQNIKCHEVVGENGGGTPIVLHIPTGLVGNGKKSAVPQIPILVRNLILGPIVAVHRNNPCP